ncbi:hypothetical protein ACFY9Y_35110 [Streptomyces fimicarius]|uniref:hypothetical protein n=1 Tax=Streptomyces griseus TaxID=1911 RepID=UPI0036E1834D
MNADLPQQQQYLPQPVPTPGQVAHHRPPAVEYRDGVPYHYTIGQPPAPQQIVVQLPEQSGMSPAQRELVINVVLLLVVAVVLCGCVAGLVVICGGTLMGLIGVVGANAIPIGITAIGAVVAAGWLVTKLKGLTTPESAKK